MVQGMIKQVVNLLDHYKEKGLKLQASEVFALAMCFSKEEDSEKYEETLKIIFESLPDVVGIYRDSELNMLFTIVSELQSKSEGFD